VCNEAPNEDMTTRCKCHKIRQQGANVTKFNSKEIFQKEKEKENFPKKNDMYIVNTSTNK